MKKTMKIWLGVATALVSIGLIILLVVLVVCKGDFTKLNTRKYVKNIYEINEEFSKVSIDTDISDIKFVLANDGKCKVECYEVEKSKHSVNINDETLVVKSNDNGKWYEYIGINISSPKVTVYLPESDKIETIQIETSTGDISIADLSVGNIILSASTGDVCLKNVIATEAFNIELDTGDVEFEGADAAEIFVETDTGDIEGSLLTDKVFVVETDTGDIEVPKTTTGGKCEIITDTGDIEINIIR